MKPEPQGIDELRIVDLRPTVIDAGEAPSGPEPATGGYDGTDGHHATPAAAMPELTEARGATLRWLAAEAPAKHALVQSLAEALLRTRTLAVESGDEDAWAVVALLDALSFATYRSATGSRDMLEALASTVTKVVREFEPGWSDEGLRPLAQLARELHERLRVLLREEAIVAATGKPLGRKLTRWEVARFVLAPSLRSVAVNPELRKDIDALANAIYAKLPVKSGGGFNGKLVDGDREMVDDSFEGEATPTVRAALRAAGFATSRVSDATKQL